MSEALPQDNNIFADFQQFISTYRVVDLVACRSRVVLSVQEIDETSGKYVTHLWEIKKHNNKWSKPHKITEGLSCSSATLAPDGTLYFLQAEEENSPIALWQQKPNSPAQIWVTHPGGFIAVQASTTSVVATANMLKASGSDLAKETLIRQERKDRKIDAVLQTNFPIQHWDHDLTGLTHIYLVQEKLTADGTANGHLIDIIPDVHTEIREASWHLAKNGTRLGFTWCVCTEKGVNRSHFATLDLMSLNLNHPETLSKSKVQILLQAQALTETALTSEPNHDWMRAAISDDGQYAVVIKAVHGNANTPDDNQLWLVNCISGKTTQLLSNWDRWANAPIWLPDGTSIIFTAADNGQQPIFQLDISAAITALSTGEVTIAEPAQITNDGAYHSVCATDTAEVFALASWFDYPPEPRLISNVYQSNLTNYTQNNNLESVFHNQSIQCKNNIPLVLPSPTPQLTIPGYVTEQYLETADGATIRASLILPHYASSDAPAPLIVWVHGGPLSSWNSWSWRWNPWIYVARGYAVLMPDPALSIGYGRRNLQRGWGRWGDAIYEDVMAFTTQVEQLPYIDEKYVAAMGGSFGGYSMNWLAGHTNHFKCIVTHASLWNIPAFLSATDHPAYWQRELTEDMHQKYSPHHYVNNIQTPLLIIHGRKDLRVPFEQSTALWWDVLGKSGLPADKNGNSPHRLLIFPTDNHWIIQPGNSEMWYRSTLAFLAENGMSAGVKDPVQKQIATVSYPHQLA